MGDLNFTGLLIHFHGPFDSFSRASVHFHGSLGSFLWVF